MISPILTVCAPADDTASTTNAATKFRIMECLLRFTRAGCSPDVRSPRTCGKRAPISAARSAPYFFRPNFPVSFAFPIALALIIYPTSAKLLVSAGAPDHLSAGATFWPEQPKPLNTCSIAIGPFGRISGLTSLNWARAAPFLLAAMETSTRESGREDCNQEALRPHL